MPQPDTACGVRCEDYSPANGGLAGAPRNPSRRNYNINRGEQGLLVSCINYS